MHYRNVNDRKETIKNIKRLIRRKEKENEQLDADLEELALSVAERRNVNEANGMLQAILFPSFDIYILKEFDSVLKVLFNNCCLCLIISALEN